MPKRRRAKPAKSGRSEIRRARALISKARTAKGKERKAARDEIEKRARGAMTDFVRERFIAVKTKREARAIQKRYSLVGVARRAARSEARAAFIQYKGRWYKAKKARDAEGRVKIVRGRRVSQANMERAQSMRAYWNEVRMIAATLDIPLKEARRAFTAAGGREGWAEFVRSPQKGEDGRGGEE